MQPNCDLWDASTFRLKDTAASTVREYDDLDYATAVGLRYVQAHRPPRLARHWLQPSGGQS